MASALSAPSFSVSSSPPHDELKNFIYKSCYFVPLATDSTDLPAKISPSQFHRYFENGTPIDAKTYCLKRKEYPKTKFSRNYKAKKSVPGTNLFHREKLYEITRYRLKSYAGSKRKLPTIVENEAE